MTGHPNSPPPGERSLVTDWMDLVACKDTDLDFVGPDDDDERMTTTGVDKARRLCAGCPVVRECLEYAFEQPCSSDYGVYGGTTGVQRRTVKHDEDRIEVLLAWFERWKQDPSIHDKPVREEAATLEGVA